MYDPIVYFLMLYLVDLAWVGFEVNCSGDKHWLPVDSYKSNYYTITTAPESYV